MLTRTVMLSFAWGSTAVLVLTFFGRWKIATYSTIALWLVIFPTWVQTSANWLADRLDASPDVVATRSAAVTVFLVTLILFVFGRARAEWGRAGYDGRRAWKQRKDYR